MEQVLPIIIICGVGLVACLAFFVALTVQCLRRHFRRRHEEFEFDEHALTVKLDKKDFRK